MVINSYSNDIGVYKQLREYAVITILKISYRDGIGLVCFCTLCTNVNDIAAFWINDYSGEAKPQNSSALMFSCMHANSVINILVLNTSNTRIQNSRNYMQLAEEHLASIMVQSNGAEIGWNSPEKTIQSKKGCLDVYMSPELVCCPMAITKTNKIYCYTCLKLDCSHQGGIVYPKNKDSNKSTNDTPRVYNLVSKQPYPCNPTH
jgi:hypothetical protein